MSGRLHLAVVILGTLHLVQGFCQRPVSFVVNGQPGDLPATHQLEHKQQQVFGVGQGHQRQIIIVGGGEYLADEVFATGYTGLLGGCQAQQTPLQRLTNLCGILGQGRQRGFPGRRAVMGPVLDPAEHSGPAVDLNALGDFGQLPVATDVFHGHGNADRPHVELAEENGSGFAHALALGQHREVQVAKGEDQVRRDVQGAGHVGAGLGLLFAPDDIGNDTGNYPDQRRQHHIERKENIGIHGYRLAVAQVRTALHRQKRDRPGSPEQLQQREHPGHLAGARHHLVDTSPADPFQIDLGADLLPFPGRPTAFE